MLLLYTVHAGFSSIIFCARQHVSISLLSTIPYLVNKALHIRFGLYTEVCRRPLKGSLRLDDCRRV
jgi:tRNA(Arg) A34 adenosine deaminase TadA